MTVTVLDSGGNPVSGAGVEIKRFTGTEYVSWGTGYTNSQGDCTMSYPDGGQVKVYVRGSCVHTGSAGHITVRI